MMGPKRVSQLSMLSILLVFSHAFGQAGPASPAVVCMEALQEIEEKLGTENVEASTHASTPYRERSYEGAWTRWFRKGKDSRRKRTSSHCRGHHAALSGGTQRFRRLSQNPSKKETVKCSWFADTRSVVGRFFSSDAEPVSSCSVMSVSGDTVQISQEEKDRLMEAWAREKRIVARKSSREAVAEKESRIHRNGSVSSVLRYDVEKAAAVKAKRNATVGEQLVAQKSSSTKRTKKSEESKKTNEEAAENFFAEASSSGNTNVDSYLTAKQYRCDSSDTDWPCQNCVTKRRANIGISVCTMVVTVIAMIVGALIITNASHADANANTPPAAP